MPYRSISERQLKNRVWASLCLKMDPELRRARLSRLSRCFSLAGVVPAVIGLHQRSSRAVQRYGKGTP